MTVAQVSGAVAGVLRVRELQQPRRFRGEQACRPVRPGRLRFRCKRDLVEPSGLKPDTNPERRGERYRLPRQNEAMERKRARLDAASCPLAVRLARNRIGGAMHQGADTPAAGILVAPMDRHEDRARPLPLADDDPQDGFAVGGADARETPVGYAEARLIAGVDLDVRLGQVLGEARALAGPCHRMPLVANTAGVQAQRKGAVGGRARLRRRADQYEPSFAVGGEKAAGGEEPRRLAFGRGPTLWPLKRQEGIVLRQRQRGQRAEIEGAGALVLERGE